MSEPSPSRPPWRSPTWRSHALFGVAAVAAFVLVLALHGFLPGRSQPALMALENTGMIECLHRQGASSLTSWCMSVGMPTGAPLLTGLPQVYTGWLFSYVPGIDAWRAGAIANVLFDAAGFVATYLLLRRWLAPRWIGLLAATMYAGSLSIVSLNGMAYTFTGYVLLPLYVLASLRILDSFGRGSTVRPALATFAVMFLAVFTDGYSFFAAALLIGPLVLAWALRNRTRDLRASLAAVGAFGLAAAAATVAYTGYAPGSVNHLNVGIGAFRYLGLDLATLFLPQPSLWWPSLLGWHVTSPPLWGDGTNVVANYVGVTAVVLVVWLLWRGKGYLSERARTETGLLVIAGLAALVLALGPALKIYSVTRPVVPSWDVPVEFTTLPLPTEWLYEHVPGLRAMRATFRWFLATRLMIVVVSAAALTALWTRAKPDGFRPDHRRRSLVARSLVVVLAGLLVGESAVNVPATLRKTAHQGAHVAALRWGVIEESGRLVHDDEVFLMLPTTNDFLANGLVPFTGRSYNVGFDKNYALAKAAWPASVTAAANGFGGPREAQTMCRALASDVDAIMLPTMDPYRDALSWPPRRAKVEYFRWNAAGLAADPRFVAEQGAWMTVLRSSGADCADPAR